MPALLEELRDRLLRAGVAPRHVARYVTELAEHFDDLLQEEQQTAADSEAAERAALERLGSLDTLTRAMVARSELRSWSLRVPWAVFILIPMLVLLCCVFVSSFDRYVLPVLIGSGISVLAVRRAIGASQARRMCNPTTHR